MSMQFQNPPLAELAVEVRWGPAVPQTAAGMPPKIQLTLPRSQDEAVFTNFAMLAAQHGYGRFERLTPIGLPVPAHFAACRFRPSDPEQPSPLFNIGKGIFGANALPPNYQSWKSFCPVVRQGIESLFEAHKRAGEPLPDFNQVLVRYIDIFNEELTGPRGISSFLDEILGIKLILPRSITKLATAEIQPNITFSVPIEIGLLTMNIGRAMKGTEVAPLLDTSVLIQRKIGSDAEAAIVALTEARSVIHDLFISLTASLHSAMRPL